MTYYRNWPLVLNVLIAILVLHLSTIKIIRSMPAGSCGKYGFKCLNESTYRICDLKEEQMNGSKTFSYVEDSTIGVGICPNGTVCDETYAFYCMPKKVTTTCKASVISEIHSAITTVATTTEVVEVKTPETTCAETVMEPKSPEYGRTSSNSRIYYGGSLKSDIEHRLNNDLSAKEQASLKIHEFLRTLITSPQFNSPSTQVTTTKEIYTLGQNTFSFLKGINDGAVQSGLNDKMHIDLDATKQVRVNVVNKLALNPMSELTQITEPSEHLIAPLKLVTAKEEHAVEQCLSSHHKDNTTAETLKNVSIRQKFVGSDALARSDPLINDLVGRNKLSFPFTPSSTKMMTPSTQMMDAWIPVTFVLPQIKEALIQTMEPSAQIMSPSPHIISPPTKIKSLLPTQITPPYMQITAPSEVITAPSALVVAPSALVKEPPTVVKKPAALVKEPPALVKEPPALVKEPPALVKKPPALVKEPSALIMTEKVAVLEQTTSLFNKDNDIDTMWNTISNETLPLSNASDRADHEINEFILDKMSYFRLTEPSTQINKTEVDSDVISKVNTTSQLKNTLYSIHNFNIPILDTKKEMHSEEIGQNQDLNTVPSLEIVDPNQYSVESQDTLSENISNELFSTDNIALNTTIYILDNTEEIPCSLNSENLFNNLNSESITSPYIYTSTLLNTEDTNFIFTQSCLHCSDELIKPPLLEDSTTSELDSANFNSQFVCETSGIFPDLFNASLFYVCEKKFLGEGYVTIPGVCPEGSVFDAKNFCCTPQLLNQDTNEIMLQNSIDESITAASGTMNISTMNYFYKINMSDISVLPNASSQSEIFNDKYQNFDVETTTINEQSNLADGSLYFQMSGGTPSPESHVTPFECSTEGRFPDQRNNSLFHICYKIESPLSDKESYFHVLVECPEGQVYYQSKQTCGVSPLGTDFNSYNYSAAEFMKPSSSDTPPCKSPGRHMDPQNRDYYFLCYEDPNTRKMNYILFKCPPYMIFDSNETACTHILKNKRHVKPT